MSLRIAVVGAGIGGLTFALAAQRAEFDVTVYEQAPTVDAYGAGLQLWPNAVRLLDRLGIIGRLASYAVLPQAYEFRHWHTGEVIASSPVRTEYERRFGYPHHLVRRNDLHRSLLDSLAADSLKAGRRCTGVEEHDDRVSVSLADGTSVDADLVVGADGIHSTLRHKRFDDAAAFSGAYAYRGVVANDVPTLSSNVPVVRLWPGPGQHFVCYPISGQRLLNFVGVITSAGWPDESWSLPASVSEASDAFADGDPMIARIIGAADQMDRWALFDREPLDSWTTGRTCLLGDAAHPMLPHQAQGASQAIEDAVTLAALLRHVKRLGVKEVLRRYVNLRRPRTTLIQAESRRAGLNFYGRSSSAATDPTALSGFLHGMTWIIDYDAERAAHESACA
jgi:salicylate hydroxylase